MDHPTSKATETKVPATGEAVPQGFESWKSDDLSNAAVLPPPVEPTFWQEPFAQNGLPLLISLLLHIGLLIAGLITFREVILTPVRPRVQEVIPESSLMEGAGTGGVPNPGLGDDPTRPAVQDQFTDVPKDSEGWMSEPSQTLFNNLVQTPVDPEPQENAVIGLGSIAPLPTNASPGDNRAGGPMAPFGTPAGGGAAGPKSPFMGIGGNARRVIYLCDASGSMVDNFDQLKVELRHAIEMLRPTQAFNVIFFRAGRPATADNEKLLLGTPENKQRAFEFLQNTQAHEQTDPMPALELAFAQKPQLIYLLTDGDFPNNNAVLEQIRALNADKSVRINTILFMGRSDKEEYFADFIQLMKTIASENGGLFKAVRIDDIE